MPSGPPWTSIVLIVASDFASNIATGLLLANPCCDFASTATPCALTLAISPTGFSVTRSKTVIRPEGPLRGTYNLRPASSAYT